MKRENFYSIFFISISLLMYFLFISPKFQSLSILNSELSQKKIEFESLGDYFREVMEISERLKNYQDSISKIDFALPEDPKIFSLFNFLQKISSQSGLLVEEIDSISSEQQGDLKKWTSTFQFKGDYPSFKNFISSLEKSSRLIKVEKITMKSGEKGLSFSITISVFSF